MRPQELLPCRQLHNRDNQEKTLIFQGLSNYGVSHQIEDFSGLEVDQRTQDSRGGFLDTLWLTHNP